MGWRGAVEGDEKAFWDPGQRADRCVAERQGRVRGFAARTGRGDFFLIYTKPPFGQRGALPGFWPGDRLYLLSAAGAVIFMRLGSRAISPEGQRP